MTDYIVNEVLCTLRSKFGQIPKATIVSVFGDFYTEDEISSAKRVLLEAADSITPKPDEFKKIKTNRVGNEKLRRDLDDLLLLYSVMDARKQDMPRFLAENVDRIPSFRDFEVSKLTISLSDITEKVDNLRDAVKKVSETSLSTIATQAAMLASLNEVSSGATSSTSGNEDSSTDGVTPSTSGAVVATGWNTIVRGRAIPEDRLRDPKPAISNVAQNRRKIVGSRTGPDAKISASTTLSSENKSWHLFIGRLHQDTTEEILKVHLTENGIIVNGIKKINATKDWQRNSAAFRVSVGFNDKDSVMTQLSGRKTL